MSVQTLDDNHRLTPWLHPDHREYVIARYAGLVVTEPRKATVYLSSYKEHEEKDKKSYDEQRERAKKNQKAMGVPVSEFPDREYLNWNPEEAIKNSKGDGKAVKENLKKVKEEEKAAKEKAKAEAKAEAKTQSELNTAMDSVSDLPEEDSGGEFVALSADDQRMKLKELGVGEDEDTSNEEKRLALYLAKVGN